MRSIIITGAQGSGKTKKAYEISKSYKCAVDIVDIHEFDFKDYLQNESTCFIFDALISDIDLIQLKFLSSINRVRKVYSEKVLDITGFCIIGIFQKDLPEFQHARNFEIIRL